MSVSTPVRFSPSVETPQPTEQEAVDGLKETFGKILDTTSKDYGHAVRGVHAKGHGLIRGTLTIVDGLPPELAQGLFAQRGQYEALLRISTGAGDILHDAVTAPRGAALKVFGVPGERLPGSDDGDQDFLMSNGPIFGVKTPDAFLKNLKLLAATTDKAEGLKKAWSAVMQTLEGALEAVGGSSTFLSQLGGLPEKHPLGETYFSQVPYRFGDHIAKFSLAPVSPSLLAVKGDMVNVHDRPDAIREDIRDVIIEQGGVWELRAQLCTDLEKMPIEDPTVAWDEEESPFVTVARFEAPAQVAWENGVSQSQEAALAFSPWHGLAAHQPLGAINRARKPVYEYSQGFRSRFNGCPLHQVKQLEDLDA